MDVTLVSLPKSVENLQLPDPALVQYYSDLENRIIWLDDEVGEDTLYITKYILQWNQEDKHLSPEERKPIKLFIFSPGGDLSVNNSLIDVITLSKTPVYGYNMGNAYSSAAYILLSCHKRFTLPRSKLLFHQGSGAFSGTYAEILPSVLAYQAEIEKLTHFVCERTSYTEEEVAENIVSDWYITAQEGLEHGVYDAIVDSIADLLP